jgi:Cu(I)/Ag(I) efflux system protein CusF
MRSTSIFLLITSVLTFSSAHLPPARKTPRCITTMSSMAEMPGMKKPDDSATLYSASGVIKAWRDDAVVIAPLSGYRAELAGDDHELCAR